jgi:hypothetical protein
MKKIYTFKLVTLLLAGVFALAGCNKEKEESLFAGSDNSIVAFTLMKNGVPLKAAVSPNALVITAPERLSLEGATATVTLSENATIEPNPAAITDWDAAQTFTVTAYNGAKSTYAYSVERRLVSRNGDVVLLTQAEVEDFAVDLDADQLKGSLTVGAATGQDTVYSLAPLAGQLKIITGGITINATYAGKDLVGLSDNMEKTGDLVIRSKKLRTVSFPKLAAVRLDMNFDQATLIRTLDFPELTTVDKNLRIYYVDSVATLNFPKLRQVEESVLIQGRSSGTQNLQALAFPALQKVGGSFTLSYWREVPEVNLPELTSAGSTFTINYINKAERIVAPKLESVAAFALNNCAALKEKDFRALKTTNSINVSSCAKLAEIALPALETTNSITLSSCAALAEIDFRALKAINASISMSSCAALAKISFPALETVGVTISISSCAALAGVHFPGLKTVTTISMSNCAALKEISCSALETIGTLTLPPSTVLAAVRFPKLTSATATITIANVAAQADLQFPLLKNVGNTLRIQATALTSLDAFAAVETIGSTLNLDGAAALTSLAGLSSLNSVGTLTASGLTSLTEIDLSQIKPDRLNLSGTTLAGLTLKGDEEFPGYLYISSAPAGATTVTFSAQGIKTVGTLEMYLGSGTLTVSLPWVERITGQFRAGGSGIKEIDFPHLQAVGYLYFNGLERITTCNFPTLKTMTNGGFFYQMATYEPTTIEFPELESVVGDINIVNPYTNRFHVSKISFPKLETIAGTLTLSGTTNQNALTDLSAFSKLRSVAGVSIRRFLKLKNFEPLKNVIPSLDAGKWSVTECGYNPTHKQMIDGAYSNE